MRAAGGSQQYKILAKIFIIAQSFGPLESWPMCICRFYLCLLALCPQVRAEKQYIQQLPSDQHLPVFQYLMFVLDFSFTSMLF